ncbi:MAG: hypothetical protein WCZ43_01730 [Proteiniphilum sp.]
MQTPNEHISLLTELLPRYRSVNILYRETVDKFVLSFDAQCTITDFYKEFNDVQAFEKAVMNILLSTDKEKSVLITSNLRTEIHKNIDIYTSNKDFFDRINAINVCAERHNPLNIEIDGQLKNTNKLWKELTQVRNSLESASWQDDKIATQRLTKEEERLEQTYKKEQEKLKILYEQQKESDNHASKYLFYGKLSIMMEKATVWLTGKQFLKKNRKKKMNKKRENRMRILTNKLPLQLMHYCY